jgi:hypothetical protein
MNYCLKFCNMIFTLFKKKGLDKNRLYTKQISP